MKQLDKLFRSRIGISEEEAITFASLDRLLTKTALALPFENIKVISKSTNEITRENLVNKILVKNEGGLCYELNTLLYFFLLDNGLNVKLIRGGVFNQLNKDWETIGKTHVTILLAHENKQYIVDTGFGGNLPLVPVPLDGSVVGSSNGEFRVKKVTSPHGDHILELKLKHKDKDWKYGYAFSSKQIVTDDSQLNEIQSIISDDPGSPFNKNYLLSLLTTNGSLTLTSSSITKWSDGTVVKENIDNDQFPQLAKQYFGISI